MVTGNWRTLQLYQTVNETVYVTSRRTPPRRSGRPPCVGEGAYTDEEQRWCTATIDYLIATLDADDRQSRGIPENAAWKTAAARPVRAAAAAPAPSPHWLARSPRRYRLEDAVVVAAQTQARRCVCAAEMESLAGVHWRRKR
jgi:hypothetical protein